MKSVLHGYYSGSGLLIIILPSPLTRFKIMVPGEKYIIGMEMFKYLMYLDIILNIQKTGNQLNIHTAAKRSGLYTLIIVLSPVAALQGFNQQS